MSARIEFDCATAPSPARTRVIVGPLTPEAIAPPEAPGAAIVAAPLADPRHPAAAAIAAFVARATGGGPTLVAPPSGPAGDEGAKALEAVAGYWRAFADAGLERRGRVVIVGGGALSDAAGFAAATWHRGVPAWYVPTTLVAQVDAALGGKTALDLGPVKNQIGVVRQPELVWADPGLLATLPDAEFRSGLGEVVKTALLAGGAAYAALLADAAALRAREPAAVARAVAACLRYKAAIVAGDPDDRGLARYVLNAGHTIGHVYEAAAAAAGRPMPHGLCVAAGLLAEARLLPGSDVAAIAGALDALALRVAPPPVARAEAERWLRADKKRTGTTVRLPLLRAPGDVRPADVPLAALAAAVAAG